MKTLEGSWAEDLADELSTICLCFHITRTDGTEFFFTNHDVNILIDGDLYVASTGVSVSVLKQSSDLSVDTMELTTFFDDATITKADILAGRWDYAAVDIYFVNWVEYQATEVS